MILFFLLVTNVFAQEINLDEQFASEVQIQKGSSCHIFASAAIFEAACYRATGKRIDVSEAYLMNQHLQYAIKDSQQFAEFHTDAHAGLETVEAGYELDTINLMLVEGNVCEERNFPMDKNFFDMTEKILMLMRKQIHLHPDLREIITRRSFHEKMTEFLKKDIQEARDQILGGVLNAGKIKAAEENLQFHADQAFAADILLKTKSLDEIRENKITMMKLLTKQQVDNSPLFNNKNIKECLKHQLSAIQLPHQTQPKMIEVLNRGLPFMCSGNFNFKDIQGPHVATIIGYRPNPDFPGGFEFRIRDSNFEKPEWGFKLTACEKMTYIVDGPKN